jgi:hypothetical protein
MINRARLKYEARDDDASEHLQAECPVQISSALFRLKLQRGGVTYVKRMKRTKSA